MWTQLDAKDAGKCSLWPGSHRSIINPLLGKRSINLIISLLCDHKFNVLGLYFPTFCKGLNNLISYIWKHRPSWTGPAPVDRQGPHGASLTLHSGGVSIWAQADSPPGWGTLPSHSNQQLRAWHQSPSTKTGLLQRIGEDYKIRIPIPFSDTN